MKLESSGHIFEKRQISNLIKKIRPLGAELFHVDDKTDRDMTKLIAIFRNFVNAPVN
jgi:hypothetical protein